MTDLTKTDPTLIDQYSLHSRMTVRWDELGKLATIYFLTESKRCVVLTMPATILRLMKDDIAAALADRPHPTPGQ